MVHCEKCGNEVLRSYGDEKKIKLRTNIIVWELDTGRCFCKCLECRSEVPILLTVTLPGGKTIGGNRNGKTKGKT